MPKKQPIENSKQPVVTCFDYMKRGHSVRFCKIRKYFVPKGIMRWIPKGSEVSSDKVESKGPTFVRGPNFVAWICYGSLSKMGFTKINGRWVSMDGEHGGSSSGVHAEHDEEDQEVVEGADMNVLDEVQHVANLGAGTSAGHQGNKIPSMSSFERFMVNRLGNFAENQRNLHDLCVTNF